ncbi:ATP-binding cassette domain-containing protein [Facklamia sp. DSM 111018]|uniref:ATP-binding cassette domain-containing protein n=1 Tax=Facklamia lactis TaxID=2749967 RepID=A0ABS0LMG4_9LACT|nr:ATP-binding cassette domain-containing protein [Facklamia lactis]MBG9979967.1 ATP-binding cassette domain-containing protein [Facklamia lactis]MBG9985353.1 ATP-binding cassette domain-containing protein [Facklamia lactis]
MANSQPLQLINISKTFTRQNGTTVSVLKNINLTLSKGEVVAVIGTNGAGKSTLFNAVAGSIMLDEGKILMGSKEVTRLASRKRAANIGRVFQNPSMGTAPRMTVFENLILASKRGERRGWSRSLSQPNKDFMRQELSQFKLGLENCLELPIENLSGGQRQVVSLLMATLKQPELLLLDEHTAALDPRMAKLVMHLTQRMIEEQGLTTLMITHQLQDAIDYADRIVVMHQGEIQHEYILAAHPYLKTKDLFEFLESLISFETPNI